MSKKKVPNLSQLFTQEINQEPEVIIKPKERRVAPEVIQSKPTILKTEEKEAVIYQEDKKNRISTTMYLPKEVKRQLEELWFALRHEKSQNDLVIDALDLLFKSKGLKTYSEMVKQED